MYSEDVDKIISNIALGNTADAIKILSERTYYSAFNNKENVLNFFLHNTEKENDKFLNLFLEKNGNEINEEFTTNNEKINSVFSNYWKGKIPQNSPFFAYLIPFLNEDQIAKIITDIGFYNFSKDTINTSFFSEFTAKIIKKNQIKVIKAFKENYYGYYDNIDKKNSSLYGKTPEEYCDIKMKNDFNYCETLSTISGYNINNLYENFFLNLAEEDKTINKRKLSQKNEHIFEKFLKTKFHSLENEETKEKIVSLTLAHNDNLYLLNLAISELGLSNLNEYKPKIIPVWAHSSKYLIPEGKDEISEKTKLYKMFIDSGISIYDKHPQVVTSLIDEIFSNGQYQGKEILSNIYKSPKECQQDLFIIKENDGNPYSIFQLLIEGEYNSYSLKEIFNFSPQNLNPSLIDKKFNSSSYETLTQDEKILFNEICFEQTWLSPQFKKYFYSQTHLNGFFSNLYGFEPIPIIIKEYISLTKDSPKEKYQQIYFDIIENYINTYAFPYLDENSTSYNDIVMMIDYFSSNKNLPWQKLLDYTLLGKPYLDENQIEKTKPFSANKSKFYDGSKNIATYLNNLALTYTIQDKDTTTIIKKNKI